MKYAIYRNQFINAKNAENSLKYTCPFCHRRVILHQATLTRRAFFVHAKNVDAYYNPAETNEHLVGKRQLFHFFKPFFHDISIERYLSRINQWPDLMFGHTAIEFQCSPISVKRLKQRIAGYSRLGIKSWWILGNPYYKRRLRATYLSRFINYSKRIGFFILFWRVSQNCLECHFQIREIGGRLKFCERRFFRYQDLRYFIQHWHVHTDLMNYRFRVGAVRSEIKLNQKRLFHGDKQLITLQTRVNCRHNSLMGCPLICHLPIITFPIFKQRALLWRIWILNLIINHADLEKIFQIANQKLNFPLTFCQIDNYGMFYQVAFKRYIKQLCRAGYLRISRDGKKITRFKEPRWFNSYYDKYKFLQ